MSRHADQDLYSGLIRLHILHHAAEQPIYGVWIMEELGRHGYRLGAGTLYPLLHRLEQRGMLQSASHKAGPRIRRLYTLTPDGQRALRQARLKVRELFGELFEAERGRRARSVRANRQHATKRRRRSR